jgi:oxygen-independent coproporphyrinogen-3 oxidase
LQTLESWARTLDFILWLKPDRIAVFGYAHVPSFKKHQALIPEALLPDVEMRFRMAELARRILCEHGYAAIGIDHYARPGDPLARAAAAGTLHRNFQGYTTDSASTLIGLGASAISALPQGYVQNAAATPQYRRLVATEGLAAVRGVALAGEDRQRRAIIERLMCDLAVDLEAFGAPGQFHSALPGLRKLERQGMLSIHGSRIAIRPEWRSATRLAGACFDEYLHGAPARHSVAV